GKRYCHLLDATTGYPAESGLCSVTVVCQNGMLSDALSTVCFLLGKEKSEPILKACDAAAVFVTVDGGVSVFGDLDYTSDES
ncbi:MAG: FAD:protein FMN transferase, partial [Clostridia bacterium]|nr:FAD:protein FMN transferase [Clostridia bacterium]